MCWTSHTTFIFYVANSHMFGYRRRVIPVLQTFMSTMYERQVLTLFKCLCVIILKSLLISRGEQPSKRVPYCYSCSVIRVALMFMTNCSYCPPSCCAVRPSPDYKQLTAYDVFGLPFISCVQHSTYRLF